MLSAQVCMYNASSINIDKYMNNIWFSIMDSSILHYVSYTYYNSIIYLYCNK